jgi:hypothetical protein
MKQVQETTLLNFSLEYVHALIVMVNKSHIY